MNFKGKAFDELKPILREQIDWKHGIMWQLLDGFTHIPIHKRYPDIWSEYVEIKNAVAAVVIMNPYSGELRIVSLSFLLDKDNQ